MICEAENTVCILRKSGDNWVILQNPSFITMGVAAAFNGPLSFPNWRRDHFAYSDEVPFPQDECVLHTLLHFYLLVVIVERRRRKEPSSLYFCSYIATTLPRSISLPWHAVFYESSSNSAEQCRIRLPHQQQQNSSLLTHATCKLDTFFIGFFSLRRHFFFQIITRDKMMKWSVLTRWSLDEKKGGEILHCSALFDSNSIWDDDVVP